MRNIIGLVLIVVSGVLIIVTGFAALSPLVLIGVLLFGSVTGEEMFVDYILPDGKQAIARKRKHVICIVPFAIMAYILTLGRSFMPIIYKEEYYRSVMDSQGNIELIKITRKEYVAMRKQQREFYSANLLSKEFMTTQYSVEEIGFKKKKRRLIAVSLISLLVLMMPFVDPIGLGMAVAYEAIFVPMIILWFPDYKDAKILQEAYDRAVGTDSD